MPEVRVETSLAGVDRKAWNALFRNETEDYDYLRAIEASGLAGFRWRYLLAFEAERLVAAAPAFLMDYALETTLDGRLRRWAAALRRIAPGLLTLRVGCIGSPCTERALFGVAPDVAVGARRALLKAMVVALEAAARAEGCQVVALKDVAVDDAEALGAGARELGYCAVASQPSADLVIDFADLDTYTARLSASARKDMRRKLKVEARVRVEVRREVDDVLPRIMELYAETRARADLALETLTPEYFRAVLREKAEGAMMVLYWQGEDLLAANLLLADGATLVDKYFCMEADRGRALNLYFLSWFTNVRFCLETGRTRYVAGQAAEDVKRRLGSRLSGSAHYFRHRNPLHQAILSAAAPLFASGPELAA